MKKDIIKLIETNKSYLKHLYHFYSNRRIKFISDESEITEIELFSPELQISYQYKGFQIMKESLEKPLLKSLIKMDLRINAFKQFPANEPLINYQKQREVISKMIYVIIKENFIEVYITYG